MFCHWQLYKGSYLQQIAILLSSRVISVKMVLKCLSKDSIWMVSSSSYKITATPLRPPRPTLPILWIKPITSTTLIFGRYSKVVGTLGRMTVYTSSKSSPLAAASVVIKRFLAPFIKRDRAQFSSASHESRCASRTPWRTVRVQLQTSFGGLQLLGYPKSAQVRSQEARSITEWRQTLAKSIVRYWPFWGVFRISLKYPNDYWVLLYTWIRWYLGSERIVAHPVRSDQSCWLRVEFGEVHPGHGQLGPALLKYTSNSYWTPGHLYNCAGWVTGKKK